MTRKTPNFIAQLVELQPESRARAEVFECPECAGCGEDERGKTCEACGGTCVRIVMMPEEK
jgi:hypothetical protein